MLITVLEIAPAETMEGSGADSFAEDAAFGFEADEANFFIFFSDAAGLKAISHFAFCLLLAALLL